MSEVEREESYIMYEPRPHSSLDKRPLISYILPHFICNLKKIVICVYYPFERNHFGLKGVGVLHTANKRMAIFHWEVRPPVLKSHKI